MASTWGLSWPSSASALAIDRYDCSKRLALAPRAQRIFERGHSLLNLWANSIAMPDFLGMRISKLSLITVPGHTRCLLSHTGQSECVYCVLRMLSKDPRQLQYDLQNLDLMNTEFDVRLNLQSLVKNTESSSEPGSDHRISYHIPLGVSAKVCKAVLILLRY